MVIDATEFGFSTKEVWNKFQKKHNALVLFQVTVIGLRSPERVVLLWLFCRQHNKQSQTIEIAIESANSINWTFWLNRAKLVSRDKLCQVFYITFSRKKWADYNHKKKLRQIRFQAQRGEQRAREPFDDVVDWCWWPFFLHFGGCPLFFLMVLNGRYPTTMSVSELPEFS